MPLELKTKQKLSTEAHTLAKGYHYVRYRSTTYRPVDFETGEQVLTPAIDPERTSWQPLSRQQIQRLAAEQYDTLFANESELSSFEFMVAQNATPHDTDSRSLLVRTEDGLRELREDGALRTPSGIFIPNTLGPVLNTDQDDIDRVFSVVADWVDSEEEAHSLLRHLATALAPGWSAVKYVLLLGPGRNGKSLLMKMLHAVIGRDNISHVTRQDIAAQSPVVTTLNGKLLNLVFDGMAEYLKDSGAEKTLIAGEQFDIRKLYESTPTPVQTKALFVEGLQQEPKTKDKSTALQKRLARFQFPNVYAEDHKFERKMLAPDSLGAFLALLLDHYVVEDDLATALAPTQRAMELQLEHMFTNSLGLQFLKFIEETDQAGAAVLNGMTLSDLTARFQSWRIRENDLGTWAEPDVFALFNPIINSDRVSKRIGGTPRKVRIVSSLKPEALAFIETLKGEEDDVDALVAD